MPSQSEQKTPIEKTLETVAKDIPEAVTAWLGRLVLLYGVPFSYLIPEEEMLPKESIRFFFLDPIWIQYLVQGACSVGNTGYGDTIIDRAMNKWVQPNQPADSSKPGYANQAAAGVRDRLRNQYEGVDLPKESEDLDWPLTGFLLRSAIVEGWRGLEVMAYRNLSGPEKQTLADKKLTGEPRDIFRKAMGNLTTKQRDKLKTDLREALRVQTPEQREKLNRDTGVQTEEQVLKLLIDLVAPLKPLRIEQLSRDVMLGTFNGMIAQLVIRQPQEGLHFGLTPENGSYTKTLRELGYKDSATAGNILQGNAINLSQDCLMRDQKRGVINIGALADKMKEQLSGLGQLKDGKFTSAEFAVEMIEAPGEFTFMPTPHK
jgi:hypothetical protein